MKKKSTRAGRAATTADPGRQLSLSDGLLAQVLLHALGDVGQKRKALTLKAAGLSNSQIGTLMGIPPEGVAVVLYQARQQRRTSAGKKKLSKKSGKK
jgi:DNA-directed RNA polymerase specialized sigma24 family protein